MSSFRHVTGFSKNKVLGSSTHLGSSQCAHAFLQWLRESFCLDCVIVRPISPIGAVVAFVCVILHWPSLHLLADPRLIGAMLQPPTFPWRANLLSFSVFLGLYHAPRQMSGCHGTQQLRSLHLVEVVRIRVYCQPRVHLLCLPRYELWNRALCWPLHQD